MRQVKFILYSLPWLLIIIGLVLWYTGFTLPGSNKKQSVVTINTTLILEKVEALGKLELVKYNYKEIFDYRALSEGKIKGSVSLRSYDFEPDLKVILIAQGEAVGCIDLQKIKTNDVRIKNDTIVIHLPDPEICYYKLDHEKTRIYDFERSGWWSHLFSDDEEVKEVIEQAYREAEKQIRKAALENGILEETAKNAEKLLGPMLQGMTGMAIIFVYTPSEEMITPFEDRLD